MSSESMYDTLRNRIVAGEYVPGTQLKEAPLSLEFGVSRTPVRACLKHLVDDGLAAVEANRGVFVAAWTQWDIEEMFSLRMLLEPHGAYLAAQRATPEDLATLRQINARMTQAVAADGDSAALDVQTSNRDFHGHIIQMARSQRLKSMLATIIDMPIITRSFFLYSAADFQRSLQQHLDVTYAIEQGDAELAQYSMHTHIRMSYRRFMSHRAGVATRT